MYQVSWRLDDAGALIITRQDEDDPPADLADALEALTANDSYEWLRPEEVAALTDAPILGYECERSDTGELLSVGRVFWFPQYDVRDPVQDLAQGQLIMTPGEVWSAS